MSAQQTGTPVRLRPGVWALPLPLPVPPYEVTVYVLETDAGPYLVDVGWDTDEAWRELSDGLAAIGTRIEDVRGIIATHAHIDHYGMAPRVREVSGAWVSLHPLDAEELKRFRVGPSERLARLLGLAGAPQEVIDRFRGETDEAEGAGGRWVAGPDVTLEDGQRPEVPGWDLTAIWTPGHTPGHLCVWNDRYRLLMAGDQVLPRTVVAVHEPRGPLDDPLGGYLDSLDRLERLGAEEVLPAHEHRFTGLPDRLAVLRAKHAERLEATLGALSAGPATAYEAAGRTRRTGTLKGLRGFPLHALVARTLALLGHLRHLGLAEELPGRPPRWQLTRAANGLDRPWATVPRAG